MSVSGDWTLHYSWGCTDSYAQSSITFNSDGTFGGDLPGRWMQQDGTLLLSYDTGPARYGGTVDGNVGSGASSTFQGLDGCWYLAKQGTVGVADEGAAAAAPAQTHDVAGNQL